MHLLSLLSTVKSQQNMSLTSNLPNPILSGADVTLTCTVELSPAVDVPVTVNTVWTGPTTESLNPSTTIQESLTVYRSTLVLKSVESANSGQYTCSAKVGSGDEISASANIEIRNFKEIHEYIYNCLLLFDKCS